MRFTHWGWIFALIVAVFAVFGRTLYYPLLPWDDHENILRNPMLAQPYGAGLRRIWTSPYDGIYAPLTYTSWWVERVLGGGDAVAHAGNVALHALNALLVFLILRRLVDAPSDTTQDEEAPASGTIYPALAAFVGALIFALHPLQVEPVAWATGRKDLLAAFFSLASLWQYIEWRQSGGRGRFGGALALFVFALLAKPSAVALPLALLILDWTVFRQPVRAWLPASLPFIALAAAWSFVTAGIQRKAAEAGTVLTATPIDWWRRPIVAADSLLFYVTKVVAPLRLSPVYSRTVEEAAHSTAAMVALGAFVAIATWALWSRTRWAVAVLLFLALLLPTSGVVPFHYQSISTVADRYACLALVGIALLVATSAKRLPYQAMPIAAALAIACGVLAYHQVAPWRSSHALWSHAAQAAPDAAVVQNNLGLSLGEALKVDQSRAALEKAVELDPDYGMAHNNLAALYDQLGRKDDALKHYEEAVRTAPNLYPAHVALLPVYFGQGRAEEARRSAEVVLKHDPDNYQALAVLASVLGNQGKVDDALALLRAAATRNPARQEIQELRQMAEGLAQGGS